MPKHHLNSKGFGLAGVLIVVAALAVVGGGGAYVYHHNHKTTTTSTTGTTGRTSMTDPYAGWKSLCDTTYHYCFKYPSTWTNDNGELLSPSKTVLVNYQNPDNRDGAPLAFTPSYIQKLSSTNQDLTVVGGYYPTDTYMPSYSVVDSSLLTMFTLTIGTQSQFVNNPIFTDAGISTTTYGAMVAKPGTVSINSASDAQAWLNSADAKTSLKILQSLYYQK